MRPHAFAIVLGLIGMTMFAGTLPATRVALEGLGPGFIAMGRAVVAASAAGIALALLQPGRPRGGDMWGIAAISICLVAGFPLFTGLAMQTVGAGHGGVVLAILPIATAVAATIVGGERPGIPFWILGAVGAALVLVFTLSDSGWRVEPGDVFLLCAAISAGFGYAFSGKL
ncbi:MAG: DMT family transporter, partial [Pseudomonadota bacterium]